MFELYKEGILRSNYLNYSYNLHGHDSHRLEKYLKIEDCLKKSLKTKFALKSTWKSLEGLVIEFYYLQEDTILTLEA